MPEATTETTGIADDNSTTKDTTEATTKDVKSTEASSTTVTLDASTSTTEESVPYTRFQEIVTKANDIQKQLYEKAITTYDNSFNWGSLGLEDSTASSEAPQSDEQPSTLPDFNQKFLEDFNEKPFDAISKLVGVMQSEQRKRESTVKKLPGFNGFSNEYYETPDDVVAQAMRNPELIRALLAAQRTKVKAPNQLDPASLTTVITDDMAAKLKEEGRQEAISTMSASSGLAGEGASGTNAPAEVTSELTVADKSVLQKLGLSEEGIANATKSLDSYLEGK